MSEARAGADDGDLPARAGARRLGILVVALVLAAGLLLLWWQRLALADHFIQRELAARHIRASLHVTRLSLHAQRIENLVLGDPAQPDLTARQAEVELGYGGLMPHVAAVRVSGARLYGRVDAAGVHLGEIDKLRSPATAGEPFALPDLVLTLDDARARLETPAGRVGLSISGGGNLRDGFAAQVGALIRNARFAGCAAPQASAYFDMDIHDGQPHLAGPVRATSLACGAEAAAQLALVADVRVGRGFDQVSGTVKGGAQAARGGGAVLAAPLLDLQFGADARSAQGHAALALTGLRYRAVRTGAARVEGDWKWAAATARAPMRLEAQLGLDARAVRAADLSGLAGAVRPLAQTPAGPLAQRLVAALGRLQQDNRVVGRLALARQGAAAHVALSALRVTGAGGAELALSEDSKAAYDWPRGRLTVDGGLRARGGGLPDLALRLKTMPGGGVSGQMFVAPYAGNGARLALDTVHFVARANGSTRVMTRVRLDGPLPGGAVRGLAVPLAVEVAPSGDWTINPGCSPVAFEAVRLGAVALDRQRLTLCPAEGGALLASRGGRLSGGAHVREAVLSGHMGATPMRFAAERAGWALGHGGLGLEKAELRLGAGAAPVRLAAARLDGRLIGAGLGGEASGMEATIGTVPLLIRDGQARWGFAQGALALDGRVLVLDAARPDRFAPVESSDVALRLADGRIVVTGSLHKPGHARRLADLSIVHRLDSGAGQADFTVKGLRFDQALQPDELTALALGVVANVEGVVDGSGSIRWRGDRVTSQGAFETKGMNLAAAFGPVQGLSGRIRFTDLLGLVTAPDQEVRLASVHPGVDVHDGVLHYALLPGQRVAIRDGRWPLAGGELTLLPTVMDMSADKPRALTFRVVGLDAGAFIDLMDLDNVSATGTFDGLLPIVFDAQGGRIVGGLLVARQQGLAPLVLDHVSGATIPCDASRQAGHLSYVGGVSNENIGKAGKLAFDALKDLQYKCLTIVMDGALDGEIVTQVAFNGVNRGELSSVPKVLAKKFIGLPFLFNVRIQAPFRGLMTTAQSFADPTLLIRNRMNEPGGDAQNGVAVQPRDSDNAAIKEKK